MRLFPYATCRKDTCGNRITGRKPYTFLRSSAKKVCLPYPETDTPFLFATANGCGQRILSSFQGTGDDTIPICRYVTADPFANWYNGKESHFEQVQLSLDLLFQSCSKSDTFLVNYTKNIFLLQHQLHCTIHAGIVSKLCKRKACLSRCVECIFNKVF